MTIHPTPDECIYCGCPDHWVWEPTPTSKSIACNNGLCASTGPLRPTVAEAVAAWNKPPRQDPK